MMPSDGRGVMKLYVLLLLAGLHLHQQVVQLNGFWGKQRRRNQAIIG